MLNENDDETKWKKKTNEKENLDFRQKKKGMNTERIVDIVDS